VNAPTLHPLNDALNAAMRKRLERSADERTTVGANVRLKTVGLIGDRPGDRPVGFRYTIAA
jgi:hypothetical protein